MSNASQEHKPFDRTRKGEANGRHPNKKQRTPHPVTGKRSRHV